MQTQLQRCKVPFNFPSSHPQRTLDAMRLLAVSPTLQPASLGDVRSTELDNSIRRSLSDALYRAYWVDDQDLTDRKVCAFGSSQVNCCFALSYGNLFVFCLHWYFEEVLVITFEVG